MNNTLQRTCILALIAAFAIGCGDVGDAPKAKTGERVDVKKGAGQILHIDRAKSKIGWIAAKVTRTHIGGFHEFDGTVSVEDGVVNHVKVEIQTASIFTDPDRLVEHLKSADFFDAAANPVATFEASSFEPKSDTAGNTHVVTGNLTMAGQAHSLSFPAKIVVSDGMVTADADFKINRQDWGIKYPGAPDDLIRDDVRIMLNIVADASAPSMPAEPSAAEEAKSGKGYGR